MRIFMISPVRNISMDWKLRVESEVQSLEQQGHSAYWPLRDTPQDMTEDAIVEHNFQAMTGCDQVYVCWDGESQGCLFDLGMAYAMGVPIRAVVGMTPRMTRGKSFANLIYQLDEAQE